jgi:dipeptidyl aminopeptidase/acylaminoacyl peptidase
VGGRAVAVAALGVACVLTLAGCGERERRGAAAEGDAATPAQRFPTRPVRFRAPDGLRLRGALAIAGDMAPAVVLVNTSHTAGPRFDAFAAELNAAGFTTLSFTARAKFNSLRDVTEENNERTVALDVDGAVRFLRRAPEADPRRIGLFAQSMGGTAILYAAGTHTRDRVAATVALSPADSAMIFRFQTSGRYRPHDALLIADEAELINSQNLAEGARRSEVWRSPVDGHGAALLPDPRVRERIVGWFEDRLG